MTLKVKSRGAQAVKSVEFVWNFDDTMVGTDGVTYSLGTDTTSDILGVAHTFDVIGLPVNSVVVGGALVCETTFDTAGYDVIVGDSSSANRYLASTDAKTAGITALVPTGYVNASGLPIRISLQSDDVCTAGKMRLRVDFIIRDRVDEVTSSD